MGQAIYKSYYKQANSLVLRTKDADLTAEIVIVLENLMFWPNLSTETKESKHLL